MLRLLGKAVSRGICVEGMVGNATRESTWHFRLVLEELEGPQATFGNGAQKSRNQKT